MIITIAAIGVNFYELFYPQTFSSVVGRAAGLYMNPNRAGIALVLGMIVTLDLIPPRWRLAFALLVGTGIAITVSRSAMSGWAIVMFIMLWTKQINLRRSLAVGLAITIIGAILLAWQWDNVMDKLKASNVLNDNVMGRLEWFNQPMANDDSAIEREAVAAIAFDMFADSPLIGNGVGASRKLLMIAGGIQISSHNQYLNLMVDHGILGCLLLPLLVLASLWQARGDERRRAFAFAAFVLFMGFFSHNLLEERFILLLFSLLGAMNFAGKKARLPVLKVPRLHYPGPLPQPRSVTEL
jgi:O-antigen ligase